MDVEILLGVALTIGALCTVSGLALWSRNIIERIHTGSSSSLRQIRHEIINGNKS